jgi:hypothetical protein
LRAASIGGRTEWERRLTPPPLRLSDLVASSAGS